MALFPNPFAGQTAQPQQPVLPRVPWNQNPLVTSIGLGLLGGRNINEGLANAAAAAPAGMAAKSGMQQFMLAQQEKQAEKAAAEARKAATNEVLKNWPDIPDHLRAYYMANPEQFGDYVKSTTVGGAGEFGLTGIPGVDKDGNPVLLQLGKNGVATQAQMPAGVQISKEPIKLDAGTHYVLLDPITRQPVGQIAKDVAGQSAAQEEGAAAGKARVNLPAAEASATRMLRYLDDAMKDPALSRVTGPVGGMLPTWADSDPGGAARAQSRIDQILGATFLQAFEQLKGAGQISEIEGEKATDSLNRLRKQNMGDADYLDALMEFRKDVTDLVELARRKAQGGGAVAPSGPSPVYVSPTGVKVFAE